MVDLDQEFPENHYDDNIDLIDKYTKKIIEKFDLKNNVEKGNTADPTQRLFPLTSAIPELSYTSRGTNIQVLACLSLIGYKDDIVIIISKSSHLLHLYTKTRVPPELLRRLLLLIQRLGFRKTLAIIKKRTEDLKI